MRPDDLEKGNRNKEIGERRAAILEHLQCLDDGALPNKPNDEAQWTYEENGLRFSLGTKRTIKDRRT